MEYWLRATAELQRIGFTEDDLRFLGSGGQRTRDDLEAQLAELRDIPTGIGAQAYFARYGVDFAAVKRETAPPSSGGAVSDEG